MQGVTVGSPFDIHKYVLYSVRRFFKASPLSVTRKMSRMSPGQIGKVVDNMYVGGLAMLQARFLFGHMSLAGTRTSHFVYLRWRDIKLTKTMFMGKDGARSPFWHVLSLCCLTFCCLPSTLLA